MFETIPIRVFTIYMSNFNLVNRGKLQMVLKKKNKKTKKK